MSILRTLTWGCQSLESVTVARRLLGCQVPRTSPQARTGNMVTRYVLRRASLDDISNSGGVVLIYRQKDLTIYQAGSSDHINQLFKGLGDTMHG